MEDGQRDAHQDEGVYGDIVAFAFGGKNRLPHIKGRQPVEGRSGHAGKQGRIRNEGKQARQQPEADQQGQPLPANGRFARPSGDGGQQEGDDHAARVAPNHFVGVPKESGQLRRALIAEAPE